MIRIEYFVFVLIERLFESEHRAEGASSCKEWFSVWQDRKCLFEYLCVV